MARKIGVLFFQSQAYFGSDSMIHSLLMRYFDRDRIDVYVACNAGSPLSKSASLRALETIPNLNIIPLNFGPTLTGQSWRFALKSAIRIIPTAINLGRLAWFARRNNIRIIHGTEKPRDAFYGTIVARLIGAKSVVHLHIKCTDQISPLVKWAMRRADAIIGVSEFVAQSVVQCGYQAEKVNYVLNGLDLSRWDDSIDGAAIRREFDIGPNVPLLAIASRLFIWKGHTELVKALAIVRQRIPEVKLLIVGEDDPRAHPGGVSYTQQLKVLASDLGVADNVIFTGFRRDVAQILAACDIYTMPTFEEPCAVIFLEAMAMRKPVVALDSGGTPQEIHEGKGGLLSPPADIEALAANIIALIEDEPRRRQMGEYNRRLVENYFTPRRMARETEQVYRAVLQRRPTRANGYAEREQHPRRVE